MYSEFTIANTECNDNEVGEPVNITLSPTIGWGDWVVEIWFDKKRILEEMRNQKNSWNNLYFYYNVEELIKALVFLRDNP